MGIDCVLFQRLVELAARGDVRKGRGLMLGRQGFHHQARFKRGYTNFEICKTEGAAVRRTALQSDYQARWSRAATPLEA